MFCLALSIDSLFAPRTLIVFAGFALYIASKALSDALAGGRPDVAGRLAIGQWLPIAVFAIAAVVLHRQAIAIGIVFSTAVACLSLAIGAVAFLGVPVIRPAARRSWPMLVPAAMLTFVAGFRASISPFNAFVMAIEGVCVLLLWNDRVEPKPVAAADTPPGRGLVFRSAQLILGFALAAVGSWFGIHGLVDASDKSGLISTGLLATTLLGPLLVLPIIGTGTELAQRNQAVTAVASQVGVGLLNLCALVPMVVLASVITQLVESHSFSMAGVKPFPFPLAVWRVDGVILIALSLLLLPVAIGRWSLSKAHGIGLMIGYAIYLGLAIVIGVMRV